DIAAIDTVTVEDPTTVRLTLKQPDSSLVMALADRAGMMVSPTAVEENDGDLTTTPVGAGPWKFVEWNRDSQLTKERFEDPWDGELEVASALEFTIITDPKTRVTSLRAGQQDIALELSASDAEALESADGVSLSEDPRLYLNQVYMNRAS